MPNSIATPFAGGRVSRGFTLLELMVVLAILGLLAGYVAPRYFARLDQAEVEVARAQIDAFGKALEAYRIDIGHYPRSEQGLAALNRPPAGEAKWRGPYLVKAVPSDPWGHPYRYARPGMPGAYALVSYGRDGRPGGAGVDADVGRW